MAAEPEIEQVGETRPRGAHHRTAAQQLLDIMRHACKDKKEHDPQLCAALNKATADGRHMEHYSDLLQEAINSIVSIKEESDIDSLFSLGETTALRGEIKGLDDFELITFLVIRKA